MACSTQLECSSSITGSGLIRTNSDVAGIGVVLSFVISFAFTFLVAFIAHCYPEVPPNSVHPVDKFAKKCWKSGRKQTTSPPLTRLINQRFRGALTATLLGLCTQQQVLGIAIMSARYTICNLQLYHSEIVRILVFLCFGSQITAMHALSSYYQLHHAIRNMTVFLFLTCDGMLLHLLIIHGQQCKSGRLPTDLVPAPILPGLLWVEIDAAFYLTKPPIEFLVVNIILFILVVVFGLSSCFPRILEIITDENLGFKNLVIKPFTTIRGVYSNYLSNASLPTKLTMYILPLPLYLLAIIGVALLLPWFALRAYLSLCRSRVTVLILEFCWFFYTVLVLLKTRVEADSWRKDPGDKSEDEWNFGQVLPMVLVVLPVLGAWQGYKG